MAVRPIDLNFVFDLRQQLDLPGCDEIVLSELGRYVKTSTIENVLYTSLADALLVLHYHRSDQSEFWERVQPLLGDWNIDELAQNVVDADKWLNSGYWPWGGKGDVPITIDGIRKGVEAYGIWLRERGEGATEEEEEEEEEGEEEEEWEEYDPDLWEKGPAEEVEQGQPGDGLGVGPVPDTIDLTEENLQEDLLKQHAAEEAVVDERSGGAEVEQIEEEGGDEAGEDEEEEDEEEEDEEMQDFDSAHSSDESPPAGAKARAALARLGVRGFTPRPKKGNRVMNGFPANLRDLPKFRRRLRARGGYPAPFGADKVEVKAPFKLSRPAANVYSMSKHYLYSERYAQALASDRAADRRAESRSPSNLHVISDEAYRSNLDRRTGLVGRDLPRTLPDGTQLGEDAVSYAREHGATRAGFQQALRHFDNREHAVFRSPYRQIPLPVTARELQEATRQALGLFIRPGPISPEQLPAGQRQHPQIYSLEMNRRALSRDEWMERARQKSEYDHRKNKDWVPIPKLPGAYFRPPIEPHLLKAKNLWKATSTAIAEFKRASKIAPRPLLGLMTSFLERVWREDDKWDLRKSLRPYYDYKMFGDEIDIKLITPTELDWFTWLVTKSCNAELLIDLPRQEKTLFLVFAERLQRLMDDISEEALFPDLETKVSVSELLEVMHRGADHPTNSKAKFSEFDAACWIKRLSKYGRCRWQADNEELGFVLRPKLDIHPEHQIRWGVELPGFTRRPTKDGHLHPDDAVGAPRRDLDVDSWEETVWSNRPWTPPGKGPSAIEGWFCILALRVGYTKHFLETQSKELWESSPRIDPGRIEKSRQVLLENYKALTRSAPDGAPPRARTLLRAISGASTRGMSEREALLEVRDLIQDESHLNLPALYPAFESTYRDEQTGKMKRVLKRETIWDWGQPEVRGTAPRFFSLDRWPLEVQAPEQARRVREGEYVHDPAQTWDPCVEDPTPTRWLVEKAVPFGEKRIETYRGPVDFVEGDTPRQKKAYVDGVTTRAAQGMFLLHFSVDLCPGMRTRQGGDKSDEELTFYLVTALGLLERGQEASPGFIERLARFLPFGTGSPGKGKEVGGGGQGGKRKRDGDELDRWTPKRRRPLSA
ncbi:uncharacterized protein E0L32_009520 [Thyridium curvatum]|uniref:Uncharacterized protein n=1 Tax=Thyridium curvatum TaxID=1093900 RepID=A0A507AWX4_9PEZI|nr:uncharacterized protein E0L32_009520 [Thyridium curvatum]TPX09328.1 hypothetical protein E0L32_009520 [Thyridium curvatum]